MKPLAISWDKFDGGWTTNGDPSKIGMNRSPSLGNVVVTPDGSIQVRKGAVKIFDDTANAAGKKITMLYNYRKSDGTEQPMVAYNGVVKKLNVTAGTVADLPTAISTHSSTASYTADIWDDTLFFCNGVNKMQKYDGSTNSELTLTTVASTTFIPSTFTFKDRKMYAVQGTLLHRSKTDGGTATDIHTFNYSSGDTVENSGTSRIKEGGTPLTSVSVLDELYIHSQNNFFKGFFQDFNGSTIFRVVNVSRGVGAVNQASTVATGRGVVFFDPTGKQLTQYGQISGRQERDVSVMSDAIRNMMGDTFDFSEAATVYWKNKVLIACKTSSTQGANDVVLLFDLESQGIFPIYSWHVSCWMVYQGDLYFGSSISPQVFKAFDEYADDNTPVNWWYTTNKEDFGNAYMNAEYLYIVGTIDQAVKLDVTATFNNGAFSITKTIDGASLEYVQSSTNQGYLGEEQLGINRLGGISAEGERIFQVWIKLNSRKFQDMQIDIRPNTDSEIGAASIRKITPVNLRVDTVQPPSNRVL